MWTLRRVRSWGFDGAGFGFVVERDHASRTNGWELGAAKICIREKGFFGREESEWGRARSAEEDLWC